MSDTVVSGPALAGREVRHEDGPRGAPFTPPKQGFLALKSHYSRKTLGTLALLGALSLFLAWEIGAHSVPEAKEKFFPAVEQVLAALFQLFAEKEFIYDVGMSCLRIYLAYIVAMSVALPLAIGMGSFENLRATLNPTLSALRYLPAASFIPLLLVWFGPTDTSKVLLLFLGVVWFLVAGMLADVRSVSHELVESALTMGARRKTVVFNVILPAAGPQLMTSARDLTAVAWTYLVIAEVIGAQSGIGAVMMRAGRFLNVDVIIAGILTIGILGVLTDTVFRLGHRMLFPWAR
ncbi:ABC transporter permease [Ferruginivarius sediminum]|uniref:ABC transporter permease n=1 Tax=Ferruginivarius sediminum TaxID=2661937 RepID=A0A369TD37_9PROT|nr:ABC transporter permease [Ferruginivarius sediminum]RDD62077.1 ABC transporter permease [Ferruginivarius sediminum]